jgi:hypothetical protein
VSSIDPRSVVDTIVARDRLQLDTEDYERLVSQYTDLVSELEQLRPANLRNLEPATVFFAV